MIMIKFSHIIRVSLLNGVGGVGSMGSVGGVGGVVP